MPERSGSKRRMLLVVGLGLATVAGIIGLQIVDDAQSRSPLRRVATTTTKG